MKFQSEEFQNSTGTEKLVYCPLCKERAKYAYSVKDFNRVRSDKYDHVFECKNDGCEMNKFSLIEQKDLTIGNYTVVDKNHD